jgi:hypothetical protein
MYSAAHDSAAVATVHNRTGALGPEMRDPRGPCRPLLPEEREQLNRVLAEDALEAEGFIGALGGPMSGRSTLLKPPGGPPQIETGQYPERPGAVPFGRHGPTDQEKDATVIVGDLPDMVADRRQWSRSWEIFWTMP